MSFTGLDKIMPTEIYIKGYSDSSVSHNELRADPFFFTDTKPEGAYKVKGTYRMPNTRKKYGKEKELPEHLNYFGQSKPWR